jgi:oxygen-independent coproporphyrinogen-3 oxidase
VLSPEEKLQEALFTGLRLVEGVDVVDIGARYGVDVVDRFGRALEPFFAAGVLRLEGPRLCLSREGMLVANEVMAVFV